MGSKVARPSLRLRAVIALALLLGFYFVTIGVALLLLALAVGISVVLWVSSHNFGYGEILALAICIVPALLLLYGVFTARAPPFKAPGREIAPNDAPKLFDMLQELANSARTRAPSKVFLSAMPNVGVTQVGGFMGIGSTRVLILGAPMLHMLRVSQVRAVLAHEYGHFVGSDTQLAGIHAYTHALFVSVLRSTTVRPKFANMHFALDVGARLAAQIGTRIARLYARLYFRITHALSRRQELAADVLAAELAGTQTVISALETATVADLYRAYVTGDVLDAVTAGAMPTEAFRPMFAHAQTTAVMFASVAFALEQGGLYAVAAQLEPRIRQVVQHEQHMVAKHVAMRGLTALFEGALLEKGARARASLGKPCVVWSYEGGDVDAGKLVADAFTSDEGRAAMRVWAARLGAVTP